MSTPTPYSGPQQNPSPISATTTPPGPFTWLPGFVRTNRWNAAQYGAPAVLMLTGLLLVKFVDSVALGLLLALAAMALATYLDWYWCCLRQDRVITLQEYASKRPVDVFSTSAAKIERCKFTLPTTLTAPEVQERAHGVASRLTTAPVSGDYTLSYHDLEDEPGSTQPGQQVFSVREGSLRVETVALAALTYSPGNVPGGPASVSFEVLHADTYQYKWLSLLPVAPKTIPTLPVLEALSCAMATELAQPSRQPDAGLQAPPPADASLQAPPSASAYAPLAPTPQSQQAGNAAPQSDTPLSSAASIWSRKNPVPVIGIIVVIGLILIGFAALTNTKTSEMTCGQYRDKTFSEQGDVIRDLLREHDLNEYSYQNIQGATRAVDSYCIWSSDSSKIGDAVDWDSEYW